MPGVRLVGATRNIRERVHSPFFELIPVFALLPNSPNAWNRILLINLKLAAMVHCNSRVLIGLQAMVSMSSYIMDHKYGRYKRRREELGSSNIAILWVFLIKQLFHSTRIYHLTGIVLTTELGRWREIILPFYRKMDSFATQAIRVQIKDFQSKS